MKEKKQVKQEQSSKPGTGRGKNAVKGKNTGQIIAPDNLTEMLAKLEPHDHLCLIYETREEWRAAAVPFIAIGLKKREKCVYVVDTSTADEIRRYLVEEGIDVAGAEKSGQLSIIHETESYTRGGYFDPDKMIALLIAETTKALSEGYPVLRVTGEMTWVLHKYPGSEKILEYESKLNRDFFPKYPCLAICQYDRWKFDPEVIKGVIMTHPLLVRGNNIYRNFYYIPTDEFLNTERSKVEAQRWLNNLEREKKAREALLQSEDMFTRAFRTSPNLMAVTTEKEGKIIEMNEAFCRAAGYSREEIIGRTSAEINVWHNPEQRKAAVKELQEKGYVSNVEAAMRTSSGEIRTLIFSMSKIFINNEARIVTIASDITERRKAETAYIESEQNFRNSMDACPLGIRVVTDNGDLLYANRAVLDIFGFSDTKELKQAPRNKLYTPESYAAHQERKEKRKRGEFVPTEYEISIRRPDGAVRNLQIFRKGIIWGGERQFMVMYEDITARRQAEEELRKSEEKYKSVVQLIPDGIVTINKSGFITSVSGAVFQITGFSEEELVGAHISKVPVLSFKDVPKALEVFSSIITGKGPAMVEIPCKKKDGTPRIGEFRVSLMKTAGKTTGIQVIARDVTDRHMAEEALIESETKYHSIFENSIDAILLTSPDGRILSANPAACAMFGRTEQDICRIGRSGLLDTSDPRLEPALKQRNTTGEFIGELTFIRSDGARFPGHISSRIFHDKDGNPRTTMIIHDITARKKAEETLKTISSRQEAILASVPDIIMEVDDKKRYIWANRTGLEFFGDDVVGKEAAFYFEGEQNTYEVVKPLFNGDENIIYVESWQRRLDGEKRLLAWWCRVLKDKNDNVIGALSTARDITERRKAEEALIESEEMFAKAFHNSPNMMSIVSQEDGSMVEVNDTFCRVTGYSREELISHTSKELNLWRNPDERQSVIDTVKEKGPYINIVLEIRTKTREIRTVSQSMVNITLKNKPCVLNIAEDITERIKAESALIESEQRFSTAFDASPDLMAITDFPGGSIIDANRAYTRCTGYDYKEIIGHTALELKMWANPEQRNEFYRRINETGRIRDFEIDLRTKTGEKRTLLLSAEKITLHEKPCLLFVALDITGRKQAEQSIKESEQRFHSLFETMAQGVVYQDTAGKITSANPAAERILGLTLSQMQGRTSVDPRWRSLYEDGSDFPGDQHPAMVALRTGQPVNNITMAVFNPVINDHTWVLISAVPEFREGEKTPYRVYTTFTDITDRKKAEIAIHQSGERFRRIFQEGPLGIVLSNLDYKFIMMNARFYQMLGYSEEELLSMTFKDISFPEDIKENVPNLQKLVKGEATYYSTEKRYKKKNGGFLWGSLTVTLLKDSLGKPQGFLAMVEDITQRKQSEEHMAYLASYPEVNPNPVMELDLQGNIRYVNPATVRIFPDLSALGVKHPFLADWQQVSRDIRESTTGKTVVREVTIDGTFFEQQIFTVGENQVRIYGKDVTWRKNAEERINHLVLTLRSIRNVNQLITREKDREKLIQGVCDNLVESHSFGSAWIVLLDESRKPVTWASSNIGADFLSLVEMFKRGEFPHCAQKAIKQKPVFLTEAPHPACAGCPVQGKNHNIGNMTIRLEIEGNIYGILCASMPRDLLAGEDEKSLFTEVATDIAFALRDLELGSANELLMQERLRAAKMESIGTLAGGIAHDFNNLLTGIMGNIGLAKTYLPSSGTVFEMLDEAEKAAIRSRDLTQQLLTFARGGKPVKKLVNIARLLQESATFALRGSKAKLELSIPDDLWTMEADEGQVSQVIHNLVINADEAMPAGGILKVKAINYTIKRTSPLPLPRGKYVQLDIVDSGMGISQDHLQRIFEPYFTTKQKGSGLGLTTAYSIVKNHGGSILAESVINTGSVFHVYLPASQKATKGEKKMAATASTQAGGKILVMDDEEIIRKMLKNMLNLAGYEVALAADGAEALEKYRQALDARDPFTAVIMDLTIPGGMGGKDAVKKILEIDADAAVIVSSGYATDPIMSEYKKHGFRAVIAKPYTVRQLQETLSGLAGKKKK